MTGMAGVSVPTAGGGWALSSDTYRKWSGKETLGWGMQKGTEAVCAWSGMLDLQGHSGWSAVWSGHSGAHGSENRTESASLSSTRSHLSKGEDAFPSEVSGPPEVLHELNTFHI